MSVKTETKLIEVEVKPVPEEPEIAEVKTAFILKYKLRLLIGEINFWMPTNDLTLAIVRGRAFCDSQNYRFIRVDPMFLNLDIEDLKRKQRDLS